MPRNSAGVYGLPPANPVQPDTVIETSWANVTLEDIAEALTNSLDRQGRGGMLAPFQFASGSSSAPGQTWAEEPTSGWFRNAPGDFQFSLAGQPLVRYFNGKVFHWNEGEWTDPAVLGGRNGLTVVKVTSNVTALAGRHYHCTVGGITVTLPANPEVGDQVAVSVDNFDDVVVDTNGQPVNGNIENIQIDIPEMAITFRYVDSNEGWQVVSQGFSAAITGGLPGEGTAQGNMLVWDVANERWQETDGLTIDSNNVVRGVVNGTLPDDKESQIRVVDALPASPNPNTIYFVRQLGVWIGDEKLAEINP